MRTKEKRRTQHWFRTTKPDPDPRFRLVCFPHAGGTASFFRSWAPHVPAGVELLAVRYPGREDRLGEPFAERMPDLVRPLAGACRGLLDRPVVFFGHSMGASVAYEVARLLRQERESIPAALFVSGCSGPGWDSTRELAGLDDPELIEDMRLIGGTDTEILENPELRDLILPAIRADYQLVRQYTAGPVEQLDAPVVAYYGTEDPDVDAEAAGAWSKATRADFDLRSFHGDHFYLVENTAALVEDLFTQLRYRVGLSA